MASSLAVTVGHAPSGPVDVVLTAQRPHLQWVGGPRVGKTTQLRSAAVQLAQQIPATARLRLVLFTADSAPIVPELENRDGVVVVPLGHATPRLVARIRNEIARRASSPEPESPPLVIAVDDIDRFTDRRGLISHRRRRAAAVRSLIHDLEEQVGEAQCGVHLLLTSARLGDVHMPTWPELHHTPSPYTTIILPLEPCDAAKHAPLMAALRYCGGLNDSDTQYDDASRWLAYRVAGARAIRFTVVPGPSTTSEPAPPGENPIPFADSDVHGHPVTPEGAIAAAAEAGWRIAEDAYNCAGRCIFFSDVTHSYVQLRWTWPETHDQLIDYAFVGSTTEHTHRFMISGHGFTAEEQMAWLLGVFTCLGHPWSSGQQSGGVADRPAHAQIAEKVAPRCPTMG